MDHILLWSITALAFLPISVLFVTLIINRLLIKREKRIRINKLNMILGTCFSEVGNELFTCFINSDPNIEKLRKNLIITSKWSNRDFLNVYKQLQNYKYEIDISKVDLKGIKELLVNKREFLVRLFENPQLLEYESFSDTLRAVFHLIEELDFRKDLTQLPDNDLKHLQGDMSRAYGRLVKQWLIYMRHLKENYPYLFSLSMRTNPFDKNASPIIE
jgi:plasmid maintenance system killer protein